MSIIKKYKMQFLDIILNVLGFSIYIFAQQILLLPIIANNVDDNMYASFVLYISILNIVGNVLGGELGNTRIIRDSSYKKKKIAGDFSKILLYISIIIFPILIVAFLLMKYSILASFTFAITIVLVNIRLYAACYIRLNKEFKKIIIQNILYLIGIILSLILFKFFKQIYFLLLIPELVSIIYSLKNSDVLKMKLYKTEELKETLKVFYKFGIISTLTNLMNYFDKFLIYPILGAFSVAVYYSVSAMSKIVGLLVNPISSVVLSWIANIKESKKVKTIKLSILGSIPIFIVVFLISAPCTYLAVKFLYPKYFLDAINYIIPISISISIATTSTIIKSIILKLCSTNKLLYSYIIYFVIFIVLAFLFSKNNGLYGFIISNIISRFILFISFIIMLIKQLKIEKEKNINEN